MRRVSILIICLSVIGLTLLTTATAVVVPYDSETMNYSVTPEQAIENAKTWSGNPDLELTVKGVELIVLNADAAYVLETCDANQAFHIDCSTGKVLGWHDKNADSAYAAKIGTLDTSTQLPVAELSQIIDIFLTNKYPNFGSFSMQSTEAEDAEASYCQRLTNGVWYASNSVSCAIDQWSGCIVAYSASFGSPPGISTAYTVTGSIAEQTAIISALNSPIIADSGEGDDINYVCPQSVLLWKNRGVWAIRDTQGTERLAWKIDLIAVDETNYTLQMYQDELEQTGMASCYTFSVDANTGEVIGESEETSHIRHHPSTATPVFSVDEGTYSENQMVSMSCATNGATIRYTTDGSVPTTISAIYADPITVDRSLTLKARAFKNDGEHRSSVVQTAVYTLKPITPTFSPVAGTYTGTQSVTVNCNTTGVVVRYTVDGTEPTENSTAYTGAITINASNTLKVRAFKDGWDASDVACAEYVIQ